MSKHEKKMISVSMEAHLIMKFDKWIKTKRKEGFVTDRSHVISVLVQKFLDKN